MCRGIFDTLKVLGKPQFGILYKVEQLIVKAVSTYKFSTDKLNLWMLDRASWQRKLAEEAVSSGVKISENSQVRPEDLGKLKMAMTL